MRTPLAWLNLVHQKSRTVIAVAGVAFAILLMFMQLGFYGAAEGTASVVYDELLFDLVLLPRRYIDVARPGTFPRDRLYQAMEAEGVDSAIPLYASFAAWRNADAKGPYARRISNIMILGMRPEDPVFRPDGKHIQDVIDQCRGDLEIPGWVLIDRRSHKEYGPHDVGLETEVGGHHVQIAGQFTLGTGFGANGLLIVGDATFFQVVPAFPRDQVGIGLIRLEEGADPGAVASRLNALLPPDVMVRTRAQIVSRERQHWVGNTSIGLIFFLGVVVAFLVGVVFVYQVIASDIRNRLHEYATLKAFGYKGRYLSAVVLQQALLVALLGYMAGLVVALALYELARGSTGIPIAMNLDRAFAVLGLGVGMCALSALLSLRKVQRADPADLF
jgi:putative ABC transport system permease protein